MKKYSKIDIYTDGGSRGNPGPAAIGAVLKDINGNTIINISKKIGYSTNNVAEYLAVIYSLHEAILFKALDIKIHVDSQLVARQLTGKYKVKDQNKHNQ